MFRSIVLAGLFGLAAAAAAAETTGAPVVTTAPANVLTIPPAVTQITQVVNNATRQVLSGNTDATVVNGIDLGGVADDFQLNDLWLVLRRSPDREQAFESYIQSQHDPSSPNFHQWLTADQVGSMFGPAQQDIDTVTSWLQSQGFTVNAVTPSGMLIDFSGTAANVQAAFGTRVHSYVVGTQTFLSNANDPSIPSALSPAVVGVLSLNNHFPHSNFKRATDVMAKPDSATPEFTVSSSQGTFYALAPADFNTVYNVTPLLNRGITGSGQTIAVVEDTTLRFTSDVSTFRSAFGLSSYGGTFTQRTATGSTPCSAPGVNSDEGEAALDAEWAGVAAPGAAVVLEACDNSTTTFGGLIAAENLLNGSSPPKIISVSYGFCESQNGTTSNREYINAWQLADSEGVSVFVSSGDEGAASCDAGQTIATQGIAVSAFASTPYNIAVGGTDFKDTYDSQTGGPSIGTYWRSSNSSVFESAISYIPEIPWDGSCATQLLYSIEGFSQSYGASGFCNNSAATNFQNTAAGSGGPSMVSAKPSWQSGVVGIVADNHRDLPDVSLFASNGLWSHFLISCMSDTNQSGVTCNYTNGDNVLNQAAGGTSFSAPSFAGIQALINQSSGESWGNINNEFYVLAANEYGNSTQLSNCNSSKGNGVASSCIFYDVTQGDIDLPCTGPDCFGDTGGNEGALSTSTSSFQPAYKATTGWDFATGLGSVNASNLVAAMSANTLVFSVEPASTYSSAQQFSVKVTIENSAGSVMKAATSSVTLTLSGGTAGATFGGTKTVNAVAGVATFSGLSVDKVGTGYTIVASATNLASATSTPFAITPGTATKLIFTTEPPSTLAFGASFGAKVTIEDPAGNVATSNTSSVAVALTTPNGAMLNGTKTVNAVAGVATFSGLTIDTAGTYTLTATDAPLTSAHSSSITVSQASQTITFTTTPPSNATVGGTYNVAATGGASGNTVTFTIDAMSTSGACSISGAQVSFLGAGTCIVDANQAGNTNYTAAPQVQQSITIGKATQTISFTSQAPTFAVVGGPTYTVTATATSNLDVALTIDASSATVCSLSASTSGSIVSFLAAGTCTIDANQAGNANYKAASLVQQSFVVSASAATHLVFTTQPTDINVGGTLGAITVTEEDGAGNTVDDNATVTFTIPACGASVTLGSVAMTNGVATLMPTQVFDTPASALQITASTPSYSAISAGFNVIANPDDIFGDGFEGCRL